MKYLPIALLICTLHIHLSAQDRLFTYTYQSNVLAKGQKELEVWNTLESGKQEFYRKLRHRAEFEMGLGGNVQTAFYLNVEQAFNDKAGIGISNEWKWKLLDPVAHPVGLALYGEWTLDTKETELEGKLILDKQTGRFLHAVNIVLERGWEKEIIGDEIETESFTEGHLQYALSFRLQPSFHLGFESLLRNEWAPERVYSNLFLGPCFSYANEHFWINGTFLPQIASLYTASVKTDGLDLIHHTKLEARVLFSFIF